MAGNSLRSSTLDINKIVTSVIVSSMQSISNSYKIKQELKMTCSDFESQLNEKVKECRERPENKSRSAEAVSMLCNYGVECLVNNVQMVQNISVDAIDDQKSLLVAKIENNLKSAITNDVEQTSGIQIIPDTLSQKIDKLTQVVSNSFQTSLPKIIAELNVDQTVVNLGGFRINFITLDQSQTIVSSKLQNDSSYVEIVNDITSTITETIKQQQSTINLVWSIVAGVLIFLACLVLLIIILRAIHKK